MKAASTLYDIATANSGRAAVGLTQRITYLSNALMSVRAAEQHDDGGERSALFELKSQITDQLDVARLQARVRRAIEAEIHDGRLVGMKPTRAVEWLDQRLFTLTELYESFAEEFDLPEMRLAVLQCAGHYEKELVEECWRGVLERGRF
jgi:nuclear pore complex protein Nup155